jgi:hypothetical protein
MTSPTAYRIEMAEASGRASMKQIAAYEDKYGHKIPKEYQLFLNHQNGGRPKRGYLAFAKGPYKDFTIKCFLGIRATGEDSIAIACNVYAGRIPIGSFPIACDECDNLILLATAKPQYGRVLFWDHERESKRNAATVIAKSLIKFLGRLEAEVASTLSLVLVQYRDGTSERKVIPYPIVSVDRDKVVDVLDLKPGERVKEWGITRVVDGVKRIAAEMRLS